MAKNKHVLVKEYLKNHSLVESNITSFNNFVGLHQLVIYFPHSVLICEFSRLDFCQEKNKECFQTHYEVSI